MSHNANHSSTPAIDPAFVQQIVRTVIARLQQLDISRIDTQTNATAASIAVKVVTSQTIASIKGTPSQIFVTPRTVVTPAAYDAARERGIEITKTTAVPPEQRPQQPTSNNHGQQIIDRSKPERAESLVRQLALRGIATLPSQIVLTDTPAAELHHCMSTRRCRAAMVATITDVDRFHRELEPEVWVLDMGRMNLIQAVNVAARIAQLG